MTGGRIRLRIVQGNSGLFLKDRQLFIIGHGSLPSLFQNHIHSPGMHRLTSSGKDTDTQSQGHEGHDAGNLLMHLYPSLLDFPWLQPFLS